MVPHWVNKGYIDAWKTCLDNNASPSSGGAETRIQTRFNTTLETTHLVEQIILPGSFAPKLPEAMKMYTGRYVMTNVTPLRAEGQITWREFPIESK